jgi:hypothetical protein
LVYNKLISSILEQYSAVYKTIKPTFDENLQILTTPCTNKGKFPKIIVTIGGRDFAISSNYYIMKIVGLEDGRCAVNIEQSIDSDIAWAFGNPFLR